MALLALNFWKSIPGRRSLGENSTGESMSKLAFFALSIHLHPCQGGPPPSTLSSRLERTRTATQSHYSGLNPRSLSIGLTLGSLPNQALYIAAKSSVLPRESTMRRKRSPFARVNPP